MSVMENKGGCLQDAVHLIEICSKPRSHDFSATNIEAILSLNKTTILLKTKIVTKVKKYLNRSQIYFSTAFY